MTGQKLRPNESPILVGITLHTGPYGSVGGRRVEARMRTRLSICVKKARFTSEQNALLAACRSGLPLMSYRCDRCRQFHHTSRTKGKRVPRLADEPLPDDPLR